MGVGLAGTDREFAQADYAERINLKTMGCKVLKRMSRHSMESCVGTIKVDAIVELKSLPV